MQKFLTPNRADIDTEPVRRFFVCPSALTHYLSGAIGELCKAYNWERFGDAKIAETVETFNEVAQSLGNCMDIGTIFYTVGECPEYALELVGQSVSALEYPALAKVVPEDWLERETILLPDMRMRSLVGAGVGGIGSQGGSQTHTLTVSEMPPHTHNFGGVTLSAATLVVPDVATAAPAASVTASTGGGQPHNNMHPYLVSRCCIMARL